MTSKINKDGSNLSIVIQGAITLTAIESIIKSYLFFLPESEIIISTWEGTGKFNNYSSKVFHNYDPGPINLSSVGGRKENNFNRQIVSSKSGIDQATKKYCLKVRSDLILKNTNFIEIFNKYNYSHSDYKIPNCGFFLVNNASSKDPYFLYPAYLHFSDWFILSKTVDMKKMFNLELLEENDFYFKNDEDIPNVYSKLSIPKIKWSIESYIWSEYINNFIEVGMKNIFDVNSNIKNIHNIFIQSHCIIADNETLGISMLKSVYAKNRNIGLFYEYSFNDWMYNSGKYTVNKKNKYYLLLNIYSFKIIKYLYYVLYKKFNKTYVNKIKPYFANTEII